MDDKNLEQAATKNKNESGEYTAPVPIPPGHRPLTGPQPGAPNGVLFAEYQVAVDYIKLLTDIRFRCLVFVTGIAGIATPWVSSAGDAGTRLVLGLFGLVATTGIAVYELRNTQLYEAAMERAKHLEKQLGFRGSTEPSATVGLFGERPPKYVGKNNERLSFLFLTVKHDRGLALVYGAALGAWTYLMFCGLLGFPVPRALWPSRSADQLRFAALLAGVIVAIIAISAFHHHDATRDSSPRRFTEGQ